MLEVFTTGGGEYIVNVFNAVAAWSGGGGYKALIRVVLVMGLIYSLMTMAWNLDVRVLWKWFVQATAMYLVLMVPTTSIKVTDRINPGLAPATIANVPLGLGMMASFTSQVGDWLTRTAETVFVMPSALNYSTGGIIYGAKLLDSAQNQSVTDSILATNLNEYMKSCLFYDILIHGKDMQVLMQSANLLQDIGPGSVSLSMVWRASGGVENVVACNVGYQQLTAQFTSSYNAAIQKIAQQTYPGLSPATALARYNGDLSAVGAAGLGGGLTSAQQLTQQAMMIDAILKARTSFGSSSAQSQIDAFAEQRADVQTRNTYSTIAGGAMKWVPLLNIVLTVVFYAMFPVIFLLMLLPNGGLAVAKGYLTGFFYLASWGPLFVVLNMIFMSRWQSALVGWQQGGLTAANFTSVSAINQDAAALAGYMIMSVPFIAAGMARGAMSIASHSASFLAPSQNAAEQAAAEATTGNYSYGNVSLANRTLNTTTADQHRTAPTYDVGAGMTHVRQPDGTSIGYSTDGSTIYNSEGGMSRMPFQVSYSQDYARDMRHLLSEGQGVVESKRQAASQSWSAVSSEGSQLFDTVQRSVSSGSETGTGLSNSFSQMTSVSEGLSRQIQDRFGFDSQLSSQIARESLMSGGFSLSAGTQAALGAAAGIRAGGDSNARALTAEQLQQTKGFSDLRDFVSRSLASEEARSARDTFLRETSASTDSQVRGATSRFEASVSEARNASLEESRSEETFNRYSTEWSEADRNGLQMSRNMSQELAQYMTTELARPGNSMLRSTGFYPGMPAPNPEQSFVRDSLIDKFLDEKRERMTADLGVMRPAPELQLQGPASTTGDSVFTWGRGQLGAVKAGAPDISVRSESYDSNLADDVGTRIGGEAGRISEGGTEFRAANLRARGEGDALGDNVGARSHASLGGTTPIVGNVMNYFGMPGSTSNPFEGGNAAAYARSQGLGLKPGVDLSNVGAPMGPVFGVVASSARSLGLEGRVVTSGLDGVHGGGDPDRTLHDNGLALDFRGNDISVAQGKAWAAEVGHRLGPDYDVKFETFADPTNNHLHAEYDPEPRHRGR